MSKHGFDLLREQTLSEVASEMEYIISEEWGCESPIERLLLAAMILVSRYGSSEYTTVLVCKEEDRIARLMQSEYNRQTTLIIQPQAKMDGRRVDFVLYAFDWRDVAPSKGQWRKLLVECDGHEFHERTKEQAARDRSKDRQALLDGHDCFRFTGSEIWRDPWGCAHQVFDWAAKGFA